MKVKLSHASNPDIRGGYWEDPIDNETIWQVVESLGEASTACRAYIQRNGLGSGNWRGGEVRGDGDKIIGHVSYNGRVWDTNGKKYSGRDWKSYKEITI